jgi:hypothetical protein
MSPTVLHVVKWYPNPEDPQNGIFVKKQIDALGANAHVLGFLNGDFTKIEVGNRVIYGTRKTSLASKIALFYGAIERIRPDLIHFHCYAQDLWLLSKIALNKGIPYVHSEHWSGLLEENLPALGWLKRGLIKNYFNCSAKILPVSQILGEGIQRVAPRVNFEVIPNIIDEIDFSRKHEFPSKSFCVVGDIVFSIKRQDIILNAFRKLSSSQCELHFYGGGPDLELLKTKAKNLVNVQVHGRVTNEQVLEILPNHHAHIQFSAYETFGIATLEARKAGIWAITRNCFGSSPFADEGTLFAENEMELLKAMQDVLHMEKPSINAFEALNSKEISNRIQNCYDELL